MAPERLKGDEYDGKKNDNFAAGIILFQMVAGMHPFESKD
jgi:serine/threonine protein kinase